MSTKSIEQTSTHQTLDKYQTWDLEQATREDLTILPGWPVWQDLVRIYRSSYLHENVSEISMKPKASANSKLSFKLQSI